LKNRFICKCCRSLTYGAPPPTHTGLFQFVPPVRAQWISAMNRPNPNQNEPPKAAVQGQISSSILALGHWHPFHAIVEIAGAGWSFHRSFPKGAVTFDVGGESCGLYTVQLAPH